MFVQSASMKDISIYFTPLSSDYSQEEFTIGSYILKNDSNGFPDMEANGVAFFDVPEYRKDSSPGENTRDVFRKELYALFQGDNWTKPIYDLGTIRPGEKVEDTYFALSQTVSELMKKGIIPIIIGGSLDLSMACYQGYSELEQMVNFCSITSGVHLGNPSEPISSTSYVSHLLMQRPCFLFNYSTIGMQRPYVKRFEMDLLEKLYFDVCRLGEYNGDYKTAEPLIRNSDFVAFDMKGLKSGQVDSIKYDRPNGFKTDQFCQMAKYAGVSDKNSMIGLFNVDPEQGTDANQLIAELIWYYLDGVSDRVGDFPIGSKKDYLKFHVHLDDFSDDLVFYKSERSGRWWLEVQYLMKGNEKYQRHCMVPCREQDYKNALKNIVPNLWWKTLQKMS